MRLTRALRAAILAAVVAATALQAADRAQFTVTMLPLPGASAAGISMDYLGYDPATNAVWVPAGNTGSVDVVDAATKKVTRLKSHETIATWEPACGEDGPHGLKLEEKDGYLLVACSTKTEVLDAGHSGAVLSAVDTGDGVDDLDYAPSTRLVYVGAAKVGELTAARLDAAGKLSLVAKVPTRVGARNGVVAKDGTVFLGHSSLGHLSDLVVITPKK